MLSSMKSYELKERVRIERRERGRVVTYAFDAGTVKPQNAEEAAELDRLVRRGIAEVAKRRAPETKGSEQE
jgi:hypothetical protein